MKTALWIVLGCLVALCGAGFYLWQEYPDQLPIAWQPAIGKIEGLSIADRAGLNWARTPHWQAGEYRLQAVVINESQAEPEIVLSTNLPKGAGILLQILPNDDVAAGTLSEPRRIELKADEKVQLVPVPAIRPGEYLVVVNQELSPRNKVPIAKSLGGAVAEFPGAIWSRQEFLGGLRTDAAYQSGRARFMAGERARLQQQLDDLKPLLNAMQAVARQGDATAREIVSQARMEQKNGSVAQKSLLTAGFRPYLIQLIDGVLALDHKRMIHDPSLPSGVAAWQLQYAKFENLYDEVRQRNLIFTRHGWKPLD